LFIEIFFFKTEWSRQFKILLIRLSLALEVSRALFSLVSIVVFVGRGRRVSRLPPFGFCFFSGL